MAASTGTDGAGAEANPSSRGFGWFPPTHWSVVIEAGKDSSPGALEAFGRLYEAYRPALVAFLRFRGTTEDEATDLVQGFFESLLEKKRLGKLHPTGQFRSWLLVCLKRYLSDLWDKRKAQKRGADQPHLPLGQDADKGELDLPYSGRTPDQEFDRAFALRFVELVMAHLEEDYAARGKSHLYQQLHPWLLDKKGSMPQAQVAQHLGMSEAAVNKEVSRLRARYRDLFDGELGKLVASPAEIEAEKRLLFAALLV
ncbi:MAG TPA: sigma-70 family RNA polymerase sigma factor [Verrucomicrobiota bacterium]|jgi:RNA polymerase sigma-70 factor (ECF subfamily)|nr:sigma-70 family RNA polymerase sigma factor [Verrucomicrobiota bacterium]